MQNDSITASDVSDYNNTN